MPFWFCPLLLIAPSSLLVIRKMLLEAIFVSKPTEEEIVRKRRVQKRGEERQEKRRGKKMGEST